MSAPAFHALKKLWVHLSEGFLAMSMALHGVQQCNQISLVGQTLGKHSMSFHKQVWQVSNKLPPDSFPSHQFVIPESLVPPYICSTSDENMAGDWIQPLKHLYDGLSATSIFFTHTTQHLELLIRYLKCAQVSSGQSQIEISDSDYLTKSNFLTAISRCKNLHSFFNMAVKSLVPDDGHRVPVFSMCLYNLCQTTFWLPHCN